MWQQMPFNVDSVLRGLGVIANAASRNESIFQLLRSGAIV